MGSVEPKYVVPEPSVAAAVQNERSSTQQAECDPDEVRRAAALPDQVIDGQQQRRDHADLLGEAGGRYTHPGKGVGGGGPAEADQIDREQQEEEEERIDSRQVEPGARLVVGGGEQAEREGRGKAAVGLPLHEQEDQEEATQRSGEG